MSDQGESGEAWRIDVDRETCIGSGVCVGNAPDRFRFVDDKSQPVRSVVGVNQSVLDVAESCPVEAITVTDLQSGRVLAPEE
ncbi:MAG: ferredoxin [Sciscionella sp.]